MKNAAVAVPRFSVPSGSVMVRPPTAPPVPTHEPHALHGPYAHVLWQFCNHCTKSTFPRRTSPFTLPSFLICQGQWFLDYRQADCGSDLAKLPQDTQLQGRPSPSATLGATSPSTHGTAPPSKDSKSTPLCLLTIQDYVLNAQKLNSKSLLRRNEMCNIHRLKRSLCSLFPSAKVFKGCSVRLPGSLLS